MNRLTFAAAVLGASALAACSDPAPADEELETAPPAAEVVAVPADESSIPSVAPPAETTTPTDNTALPPEKRTSEETVKPESETLFY